jgi:UDPglucose 6-dehydrogenase
LPPGLIKLDKTGFIGLSHLGVVSSVGWASFDRPVVGIDSDEAIVGALNESEPPVHEPGLQELFGHNRGRMTFGTDFALLRDCPLVFITRDIPTDADNAGDLSAVTDLVDGAVPHLQPGVVLVLMSQVQPGFTRALGERIRTARPELAFELHYWVETLIIGDAVERFLRPERLILGCPDAGAPIAPILEAGLKDFEAPIFSMSYESAELAKTAVNLLLYSSVCSANQLSEICEEIGADWAEIVPALRTDRRIGPAAYLRPSLGVAGGNLERDLSTLQQVSRNEDLDSGLLDSLVNYNGKRYEWILRKLRRHVFDEVARPVIGVWGLAYKKNTQSTKNAFSLRLLRDLHGRAEFRVYDPWVKTAPVEGNAEAAEDRDGVLDGADALLVMTDWDEFARADARTLVERMRRAVVIDCTGVLADVCLGREGVRYVSMGRGVWQGDVDRTGRGQ